MFFRSQTERSRSLLELLRRHQADQEQASFAFPRNQFASNSDADNLSRMQQESARKLMELLSFNNGISTIPMAAQQPRNGRVPETVEQQDDQEQLAYGGPMGGMQAMRQPIPQGFNEQGQLAESILNPEQSNQIQQWEQNAAKAEEKLAQQRDSALGVALAGTPDNPNANRQWMNQPASGFPSRAQLLGGVGAGAGVVNQAPRQDAFRDPFQQPQGGPQPLSLQDKMRMLGERQAPTSEMVMLLNDARQQRMNEPQNPGRLQEMLIEPGLPGLDSMRLYQRQQFDPMMSPEQQKLKQTRDLTREQMGQNQGQFQQDFDLRKTQESNRVLDAKEDRAFREKMASDSNASKQAENASRNRNAMLEFLSRMQNIDPQVAEDIMGAVRKEFGGNAPPVDPGVRASKRLFDAQIVEAQNQAVAAPKTIQDVSTQNAAAATKLFDQFQNQNRPLSEILRAAAESDRNSPPGAESTTEVLKARLQEWQKNRTNAGQYDQRREGWNYRKPVANGLFVPSGVPQF